MAYFVLCSKYLVFMKCMSILHAEHRGIYLDGVDKDRLNWRSGGMGRLKWGSKGVWVATWKGIDWLARATS